MKILSSIFTDDLAIDLGTVNTLIFAPDRGVVLNEPSAVAIHRYTGEVLEVGAEAHKMLGREPKDVEVFRPVRGGTIENFDAVEKMLKAFIGRALGGGHRRSHVVIGVPGSSTTLEQRSVRDAARDAKATRVDLVDEGLCAAFGAGLRQDDERAHLVVDIGGGTTQRRHHRLGRGRLVAQPARRGQRDGSGHHRLRAREVRDAARRAHGREHQEAVGQRRARTARASMEIVGKQVTDGLAKVVETRSVRSARGAGARGRRRSSRARAAPSKSRSPR